MARKHRGVKNEKKIDIVEDNRIQGCRIIEMHRFFSRLKGRIIIEDSRKLGKDSVAVVTGDGRIFLNKDELLSPQEWAYAVAHCQLHLAFGHFDADKIPENANLYMWNMACDIYISKFLSDIKFGKTLKENPEEIFHGSYKDEQSIYEMLIESDSENTEQRWGTAQKYSLDMSGLEYLRIYPKGEENPYTKAFVYALVESATEVVGEAGGYDVDSERRCLTAPKRAAKWFVNHYPLLGGIASAYKIIEDYRLCIREEIQIAAIDVELGEIYINPAVNLNEEEWKFVLAHEYLHAGLNHYGRRQGRDAFLWNVACDYVINGWLCEMQIGCIPKEGLLYEEELKNLSAENIYDILIRKLKKYSDYKTFCGYGKGDVLGRKGNISKECVNLDEFCRKALLQGLEYESNSNRGYIPRGLIEEIRALVMPPIPWDVELARWFDEQFKPLEKVRTYARPSRRQGSTPDIPRSRSVIKMDVLQGRTFGVVIDTSGSMTVNMLGKALGSIASYAVSKDVPYVRVIFCDACAYDAGYLTPEEIAGKVEVKGRGGTKLQPAVDLLEKVKDFPKNGQILLITDGQIEERMSIRREHAFLLPKGNRLPFSSKGKVFYFE